MEDRKDASPSTSVQPLLKSQASLLMGELLGQEFYPRDFDAGIARQVESIVNHIAGRALARSEIASTLNNRMEACRDPALLTFFVDKTHPGWLQSLGG
jgi:hypothetical protein